MSVVPSRKFAVLCLLLTILAACSRQHDGKDFSPTSPVFQRALEIVDPPAGSSVSSPADGLSTVRFEAQISRDADVPVEIRFLTDLGSWAGPGSDVKMVMREVDDTGRAFADLRSATTDGTAQVTVSAVRKSDSVVVTSESRQVVFTQVTGALESFTTSADSALVEDVAVVLEAKISADAPAAWDEVTFKTTLGSLNNSTPGTAAAPAEVRVPTDANRVARAELTSKTAGTATVTATLSDFSQASASRFVTFSAREGALSVTPPDLNFGPVAQGTSKNLDFTLRNDGNGSLEIASVADPNGDDAFSTLPASIPAFTLAAGDTRQITVRFAPPLADAVTAAQRTQSGMVDVSYGPSTDRRTLRVPLTGETFPPAIAAEPSPLTFGSVAVGATATRVLTILNNGGERLLVTQATLSTTPSPAVFVVTTGFSNPLMIAPGGRASITITFTPPMGSGGSTLSEVLTLTSNDPLSGALAVTLTGDVLP